mmetsp:Transcript_19015/g.43301  ORF Transcript_19015/g.43301 Transcript_19015/m.43301 type:complete len:95 (+) Transcript_19015:220-504(+)
MRISKLETSTPLRLKRSKKALSHVIELNKSERSKNTEGNIPENIQQEVNCNGEIECEISRRSHSEILRRSRSTSPCVRRGIVRRSLSPKKNSKS